LSLDLLKQKVWSSHEQTLKFEVRNSIYLVQNIYEDLGRIGGKATAEGTHLHILFEGKNLVISLGDFID